MRLREAVILGKFIGVYCRNIHKTTGRICPECRQLQEYALRRLELCPYDPKPACRRCPTHCYAPDYRARIRRVMKHSGIHFVLRGRLDWLIKYFLLTRMTDRGALNRWRRQGGSPATEASLSS
ncbi:MAG: nitrous oxide-stimulated promoter family protein [Candidatus Zixiibacteriota bacterium]|nr:MAG: nitrous oxide-stimulated promoter family protein [candidate division Zixibacteria bacterium]